MRLLAPALLSILVPTLLHAQTALGPNKARLQFRQVDAHGNLTSGGRVREMDWVWSKATADDAVESPALRVWLETNFPADWKVDSLAGDAVTVVKPFQPGPTQTITIDLRARKGSLRMHFKDGGGKPFERTLAVEMTVTRPYVLVHPDCGRADVRALVTKAEGRHLYVGLNCRDLGDAMDVYFFRSLESAWDRAPGLVSFDAANRFVAFKYHFGKPAHALPEGQTLFKVGTLDDQGRASDYAIYYQSESAPRSWLGRAGLAPAYYSFYESLHAVDLKQTTLNARLGGTYVALPEMLEVSLDLSGDVFAVRHTAERLPEARFFAVDGRVTYLHPLTAEGPSLEVGGGWALWGMNVSQNTYGIKSLNGPELIAGLRRAEAGRRGWRAWFRVATLADSMTIIDPDKRQLELGALVELGHHDELPFALFAEYRNARSVLEDKTNSMRSNSVLVGVEKAF